MFGGVTVAPGARETVALPVAVLPDSTPVSLSVRVVHGRSPGPVIFVSAVVHGDEIIGMEIVRRLLRAPALKRLSGTLLAIPIVNVHGYLARSRYLPDRRDLNRCFPGAPDGALGHQLAHLMVREVLARSDAGIDLHSASNHRVNLPQIRIHTTDGLMGDLARAFGAPLILKSRLRDGSLRAQAAEEGTPVLVYESGEALRFEEQAVKIGVNGVLAVMARLGMVTVRRAKSTQSGDLQNKPQGKVGRVHHPPSSVAPAPWVMSCLSQTIRSRNHSLAARIVTSPASVHPGSSRHRPKAKTITPRPPTRFRLRQMARWWAWASGIFPASQSRSPRMALVIHASSFLGIGNRRGLSQVQSNSARISQSTCQPSQILLQMAKLNSGRIDIRVHPLHGLVCLAHVASSIPMTRSDSLTMSMVQVLSVRRAVAYVPKKKCAGALRLSLAYAHLSRIV